jgi:radical SAM protein with 4Fe4S-binding SPASM domain
VGAFKAAVEGFKACEAAGLKTGLRLTLTRHNASSIEAILDFVEQEDIRRVCFYHLVPSGRGADLQVLPPDLARQALDTVLARIDRWHEAGIHREILTVTQPADGVYLYLKQMREGRADAEATRRLLGWNGGGANSSGRGIGNIDPLGNVHPDQFWQEITLGNVKRDRFSDLWEGRVDSSRETLGELRSLGKLTAEERKTRLNGRCARCRYFSICGGGFRTRSAAMTGDVWSSDPGCYLRDDEVIAESKECTSCQGCNCVK